MGSEPEANETPRETGKGRQKYKGLESKISVINLHADVVGSLLRPPELLKAQEQLSARTISAAQFKEIVD